MSQCLKLAPQLKPTEVDTLYSGVVTGYDPQQKQWLVDHHFPVAKALSLLLEPNVGDTVCFVEVDGRFYMTQLLARTDEQAELVMQANSNVHWLAPKFSVTAFEAVELSSLGRIALTGKDCVVSAANSMIQQAENLIQQLGRLSVTARGLLRLNARQQIITAEKDVRIDGERINMG